MVTCWPGTTVDGEVQAEQRRHVTMAVCGSGVQALLIVAGDLHFLFAGAHGARHGYLRVAAFVAAVYAVIGVHIGVGRLTSYAVHAGW